MVKSPILMHIFSSRKKYIYIDFKKKRQIQSTDLREEQLFIFSSQCMVEKVLFWDQIFEKKILMDLHILRSP